MTMLKTVATPTGEWPPVVDYRGHTLFSQFQPIYSISHRRPVGHEALIRAKRGEQRVSPDTLLSVPTTGPENLSLDRLCRSLHMRSFAQQQTDSSWLFLNLNSQCLVTERPDSGFMQRLFAETGIEPHQLVIEILESEIRDRNYLRQIINHFRGLGCLIAIDDFGAGHSNFDRIWELRPDIVKIDRALIHNAGESRRIERILTGIVSLIHEAGSLVVVEGIETEREALVAIAANTDMVQGYYFGRPDTHLATADEQSAAYIDQLLRHQQQQRVKNNHDFSRRFLKVQTLFRQSISEFMTSGDFERSTRIVFQDRQAVRCYLLDDSGYQMAGNRYAPHYRHQLDKRFTPLLSGDNANWSHKHYLFRALDNPGEMQVSRPYLSVADSRMCTTISQTVVVNDQLFVFCCDLDWQDD